jgi:hypothetical protein
MEFTGEIHKRRRRKFTWKNTVQEIRGTERGEE